MEQNSFCIALTNIFFHGFAVVLTGPALSRCNRCSCIGPLAFGDPAPWCLGRLFIFARYTLRLRIQ